jgi:excisionase family DNA binding protein
VTELDNLDNLLTPAEVAERLRNKERTVRRWVFLRKIDYVKVGGLVRIPEREVRRIIEEGTIRRIRRQDLPAQIATSRPNGGQS